MRPRVLPASFDWQRAWLQHRDALPHVRQDNALYFVTFRLADSLPHQRLEALRERRDRFIEINPLPHDAEQAALYRRMWTGPMERMLDDGHGTCVLRSAEHRHTVEDTLRHGDGSDYRLGDFVIMPNHVHVLVWLPHGDELSDYLQAWKSVSAHKINKLRGQDGVLWESEAFDHIVRGPAHWKRFVRYIQLNPRRLPADAFTLGCGTLVVGVP